MGLSRRSFGEAALGTAIATLIMIWVMVVVVPRLPGLAMFATVLLVGGGLYAGVASAARSLGRRLGEVLPKDGSPPGGTT